MLRRHPRIAVLAFVLILVGAATATVLLWAQYHLHAAQRALGRFDLDEAQQHLDLCLKVRSRSAAIHLLAAQTARRRDAYSEADQHLAACIRMQGMTEAIALERSLLSAQQGNLEGVETSLRARAAEDDPEAVLVLEALAKCYLNRFWQQQALVCLNILLQRQPRHLQALLMRARLWEYRILRGEKERDQDALNDYQKAVELKPTFEARLGLAGAFYRVGRSWEALVEFEQLQLENALHPDVLLGLARCCSVMHETAEARELLDELLRQRPDHAAALLERGRLALHEGRFSEAEAWLRQAASTAALYDQEALRLLCSCLEAAHKTEEARRCQDQLTKRELKALDVERLTLHLNREQGNVPLRFEIALKLMELGREQDAVAALLFVVEQDPRHGPAHQALADYYDRTGQPGRATRHRRAWASGNPAAQGGMNPR